MTKCLGLSNAAHLNSSNIQDSTSNGGSKPVSTGILSGFSSDLDSLFEKYGAAGEDQGDPVANLALTQLTQH